ncbi:MAG TPA: ABC transporter ATP-binding protein [Candidatus Binataceae bacterium]
MTLARMYRQVFAYMRPYSGRMVLAVALVIVASAVEILKPWPLKIVIDNVLGGHPIRLRAARGLDRGGLLAAACTGLVILYLALSLLQVSSNYITISVGQRMVNDFRARLFEHLQRLSLSFHRRREVGDLMVRITYDTFSIQTIAMNGVFPVVSSLILLSGMFFVMVRLDPILTMIALAVVPALFFMIAGISGKIEAIASGARAKEGQLYNVAHRALSAIHVVQAFTREPESYAEFVESSSESLGENLRLYTVQTFYSGTVNVVIAIGTALVIYVGALHVVERQITLGELVIFTTYLASLYAPINQMFQTYGMVQGAKAGMNRCFELLDSEPEIRDRPGAQAAGKLRGRIEFEEVVFGYDPKRPVLRGIGFEAAPGDRIAVVGPTGAGKSTIAGLLARFYEPQSGRVTIDRSDIRDWTLKSLRGNIAMVLQPPLVLNETVRSNIAIGRPGASEDEILKAAELAGLLPVIAKLPNGLGEVIGQGGHSLSQGEAQRVTIARALLKQAPILIMDEPTSALDVETETLVMSAVQEAMKGRTTLVIAHRLSTIQNADRILVLNDGLIQESGTFAELIGKGGFFSYLYNLQAWGDPAASREPSEVAPASE